MKDQVTGIIVLFLGVYFYFIREKLVQQLLSQQKFGKKYLGKSRLYFEASEGYLRGIVIASSLFCIVVGTLGIFGILHAK